MTFVDVVASLHGPRPGCIACIVRNAGIARIARNDRNDCNDEETSKKKRVPCLNGVSRNLWTVYATVRQRLQKRVKRVPEQFHERASLGV